MTWSPGLRLRYSAVVRGLAKLPSTRTPAAKLAEAPGMLVSAMPLPSVSTKTNPRETGPAPKLLDHTLRAGRKFTSRVSSTTGLLRLSGVKIILTLLRGDVEINFDKGLLTVREKAGSWERGEAEDDFRSTSTITEKIYRWTEGRLELVSEKSYTVSEGPPA
jgi:hypothetical protein